MKIYSAIYFLALVLQIVIRAPFEQQRRGKKLKENRYSKQEQFLLALLMLGLIVPIIYGATHWLDFANYILPAWAVGLGILLTAISLFIFWRGHADLGANWSPTLTIREQHELVTRGIYSVIRHPMYASQWIFSLAAPLLLQNWIAGFFESTDLYSVLSAARQSGRTNDAGTIRRSVPFIHAEGRRGITQTLDDLL